MRKYYFITYQASSRETGSISKWNQVIDFNPMEFILEASLKERNCGNYYKDFIVINTCEITKDEFEKYEHCF